MSSITNIAASDLITNSRADLNNNFSALNTDKVETSVIDTDTTLAADSDAKLPTQKAVKAYVDAGGNVNATETTKGIVEVATQAEVTAGTATGATGASLIVTPATYRSDITTNFAATRFYQVSDQVMYTGNDAARLIDNAAWTLIKQTTINEDIALVRLSAEAQQQFSSGGSTDYSEVRFYINDVAVGSATTPVRSNSSYTTITHDATSLSSGDKLQVFCRVSGTSVDSIEVKEFRLNYDSAVTKIAAHVLLTPLTATDPVALNVTANT